MSAVQKDKKEYGLVSLPLQKMPAHGWESRRDCDATMIQNGSGAGTTALLHTPSKYVYNI
jgi:hypothetical protein